MGMIRRRSSSNNTVAKENGHITKAVNPPTRARFRGFQELWDGQRGILVIFAISLLFLLHYISSPVPIIANTTPSQSTYKPANFHVIIPASKEDPNLCKVLLSAAIAGYPSPVVINWHKQFDDEGLVEGGSHLAKISGVYDYLTSLDDTHDNDLLLLIDGFDTWPVLRPQTLIDRYFDINRRADERIRAELGSAVVESHSIRQEIIFGCQKRCWPWTFDDPPCYAVPESSLPRDVYGPQTDTDVGNEENPYIKYRQRYLNSGVGIGTVRAMRKMFGQALDLAQKERNFGSDQYIFSHIFGDQELWREIVRRDQGSWAGRADGRPGQPRGRSFPEQHLSEVRQKAESRLDKNYEFGIGLDYESKIGLNTVFAEDDTEWLVFADEARVKQALHDHGATRSIMLDEDVANSLPPFWTFTHESDLPRWTSWSQVPLFTNMWTGIIPAVIHHNAHRNGMKSLRETWWPNIWFSGHARTLLDAHIYGPVIPLAYSGYEDASMREYWPYEIWKGGARNGNASLGTGGDENWIRFDVICRDYHEEIFRDDLGPWILPAVH